MVKERAPVQLSVRDAGAAVKEEIRQAADRRFETALRKTGARDPREFYRNC
jgi:hypothetical protein